LGQPQPDAEPFSSSEPVVTCCESAEDACEGAHALAILTEWDVFCDLDYAAIYDSMVKPAFAFDGRNLLDLKSLRAIGFQAFGIGKG
jgi:UDPglucose 6-dehydrogenase